MGKFTERRQSAVDARLRESINRAIAIGNEQIETTTEEKQTETTGNIILTISLKKGRPKSKLETLSKRVALKVKPSMFAVLAKHAIETGTTVNALINEILKEWIKDTIKTQSMN